MAVNEREARKPQTWRGPSDRPKTSVSGEGSLGFWDAWKSVVTGLAITGKRAIGKPVTVRYPFEKMTVSPRWRGALRLRGVLGQDDIALIEAPFFEYNGVIEGLHTSDRLPACVGNCPANVDARGQNYLVAENKHAEAYELVRDRNTLPGVLGRICHHPCESACRRNHYDEALAVRPLHGVAAEEYSKVRLDRLAPLPVTKEQKIAVIGSGPSGLTASFDLMKQGYAITMFEKENKPGGALYSGVPPYRLPRNLLHEEIDDLVRMGLDLRCDVEVGRDITTAELLRDYDAVLVAVGLQDSRLLPIPGTDAEGVRGALEFLKAANWQGEAGVKGKRVFVIGGGNVAVDVARCALRVGASEVTLGCLESDAEMPCHPWEIEEALDEGITAMCSYGPEEVLTEDGKVVGIRLRECMSVFDETGRFAPKMGEGRTDVPADVVVFSIGQGAVLEGIVEGTEIELTERGQLKVDGTLFSTSLPGVFASGEVVTGPGSAIGSIATGHEAAISIHRYLSGQELDGDRIARPVPVYDKYEAVPMDGIEHSRHRIPMPMAAPEERRKDFRLVELGMTHQESLLEAVRCLRCSSEVCVGCEFCARTCPDYAIQVDRVDDPGARRVTRYDLDLTKCCFCGLCAEQCPTDALCHTGQYELSFYHRDLMLFDREEMMRDPSGSRATGLDGLAPKYLKASVPPEEEEVS